jgi:hypothetical protein
VRQAGRRNNYHNMMKNIMKFIEICDCARDRELDLCFVCIESGCFMHNMCVLVLTRYLESKIQTLLVLTLKS